YQWLFQGHIVRDLLVGAGQGTESARSLYEVTHAPVTNLVSPVGIGLLNLFFALTTAGRIFLALCVLSFAYAFAYLVRSVQQRPTAIEFLGFPWAFGYFMYKGYDSYLFSLALAFVAIGWLHRSTVLSPALRLRSCPSRANLVILTLLGT